MTCERLSRSPCSLWREDVRWQKWTADNGVGKHYLKVLACAWRIVISPATGHVTMFHALSCLTCCLSTSNWMLLILKAPRLR